MNSSFLAIIKRIIAEQGENILADPNRLKPFVSDYASTEPKEDRLAFGRAIQNGFYMELKQASPANRASVRASQVSRLQTITGYDAARCSAAVDLLEAAIAPSGTSPAPSPGPSPAGVPVPRHAPAAAPQNASVNSTASPAAFSKPQVSTRTLLFAIAAGIGAFLGNMLSDPIFASIPNTFWGRVFFVGLWAGCLGLGISIGLILMQTVYLKKKFDIGSIIKSALTGIVIGIIAGGAAQLIYNYTQNISDFIRTSSRVICWGILGWGLGLGVTSYISNYPKKRAMIAGFIGGIVGGALCVALERSGIRGLDVAAMGLLIGLFISWVEEALRQAWITIVWGPKETRTIALGEKPITFGSTNEADIYLPKRAGDANSPAIRAVISIKNGAVEFEDRTTGKRSIMKNGDEVSLDRIKVVVSTKQ